MKGEWNEEMWRYWSLVWNWIEICRILGEPLWQMSLMIVLDQWHKKSPKIWNEIVWGYSTSDWAKTWQLEELVHMKKCDRSSEEIRFVKYVEQHLSVIRGHKEKRELREA